MGWIRMVKCLPGFARPLEGGETGESDFTPTHWPIASSSEIRVPYAEREREREDKRTIVVN
jgi:hypothetical protein